ncbi:MAG: YggS family pyridoxal phosphate-dependent enzyme [Pirellula sp.]
MNSPFSVSASVILDNYAALLHKVELATSRSGRSSGSVRLVGVTKYVDSETTRILAGAGCLDLGESRPQSVWQKSADLEGMGIRWHLIGHLQRNKVKRTLPLIAFMHSLDSERLLQEMVQESSTLIAPVRMLLEVNISEDKHKTGLSIEQGERLLEHWLPMADQTPNLSIVGLMGMASLDAGEDQARREFEQLRLTRDRWSPQFGLPLHELSMGMSHDFEIAIEQGATMVRIGSILFEANR